MSTIATGDGYFLLLVANVFMVLKLSLPTFLQGSVECSAAEGKEQIKMHEMVPSHLASRRLCSSDYFSDGNLTQAIAKNDLFHKLGGNLKSVQLFRDRSIDGTLQKLQIQFLPDDEAQSESVTSYLEKHHENHFDPRGGYGQALPGKYIRKGGGRGGGARMVNPDRRSAKDEELPELMSNRWIEPIEEFVGRDKWDAALGPIGPTCPNLMRLGKTNRDGYKFICQPENSPDYIKNASGYKQECHIISVGGNDNWAFEIAAADILGCVTHTFDCTLPDGKPRRKPDRDDIRFYPHCIDGRSYTDGHGRSYLTFQDMLETAGVQEPPSYFKIDVEGFEYDIFSEMIQQEEIRQQRNPESKSLLPQQIAVELHWATRMTGVPWMPRTRGSGELALFSSMMYLGGGYLPIHLDFNVHCSTCMEVLYLRAIC
jgi:hypothetical protein